MYKVLWKSFLRATWEPVEKWFLEKIYSPHIQLRQLIPEFNHMRQDLIDIRIRAGNENMTPLYTLAQFLKVILNAQLAKISRVISLYEQTNYGQHDKILRRLKKLRAQVQRIYLQKHSLVDFKHSESLLPDGVILRCIPGVPEKSLYFWQNIRDSEQRDCFHVITNLEPGMYAIMDSTVRAFVMKHSAILIEALGELDQIAA